MKTPAPIVAGLAVAACSAAAAAPMTLDDYMALSGPAPTAHIAYGPAPSQFAELFQPMGKGPFPVVVLIHGGCWSKDLAGISQMHDMAGALQAKGIAVWNVEYRRVDEPGGGYPGTYQDVNAALAALQANASAHHLDTKRIVAMGHSAGGHLVQWIGGRGRLPADSPLRVANPLPIKQIISLGGLADLRGQARQIKSSCDVDVAQLTGSASAQRPDPFADTSPAELIPNGSHTVLINGALDTISSPSVAADYARLAQKAGDSAVVIVLPGASHFDEVATRSPAWKITLPVILKALGMGS